MLIRNTGHNRLGLLGEKEIADLFTKAGYKVEKDDFGSDLVVVNRPTGELLRVEVKTARKTTKGFQFCLRKSGHTTVDISDLIVLLCVNPSGRVRTYCMRPCECQSLKITVTSTLRWAQLECDPVKRIGELFNSNLL